MPISFTITLSDKFRLLRERALAAQSHTVAEMQLMLDQAALDAASLLVRNSPVSKGGPTQGKLRAGWQIRSQGTDTRVVFNDVPYLKYVMGGHGWIYPKSAKVLRFQVWPSGQIVFAARVKPVAPNTFVQRSIAEFKTLLAPEIMLRYGSSLGRWWMGGIG